MQYFASRGALAVALILSGCSSGAAPEHQSNAQLDAGVSNGGDPSSNGNGNNNGSGSGNASGCVGLQCQQVTCSGGTSTSLTGKVFAPDGVTPLYNAIVYVPNTPPAAFTDGVSCDRCNGSFYSNPVVSAITDPSGSFTLSNVPVGNNIPIVVQLGKWRRQSTINVPQCVSTPVPATSTSLPKNASQGDIPRIAIASGQADPFECLLLKVGIDPNEITVPNATQPGRINFWLGENQAGTTMPGAVPINDSQSGLFSTATIMKYDVVILPCEGTNDYKNTTTAQQQLLVSYLNAGGRLFSTHYSYQWLTYANSPYNAIGTWSPQGPGATPDTAHYPCGFDAQQSPISTCGYDGTIDATFPKGMAFGQWMANVARITNGQFEIVDPRADLDSVDTNFAQRWMYHAGDKKVMHTTFNTPLMPPRDDMGQPQYCGRVVFSDFHVSANEVNGATFPDACVSGPLTTQEKALVFMLFDLSSCVQADSAPPVPPIE
jgi:hypothetical protein